MSQRLRVLLIEDSEDDAVLIAHEIQRAPYDLELKRVETVQATRAALEGETWDIVISDYALPQFNGLEAMRLARELQPDLPFILISGTLGEEAAVTALKGGADDYILKDNLARLRTAIERELREAAVRRARREAEAAAQEQRALAEALRDTAEALNSTLNVDGVLDRILANVVRVVPHEAANIMLIESGIVHVARRRGYIERGTDEFMESLRFDIKEWRDLFDVQQSGKPRISVDTHSDPLWYSLPETAWIRSHIGAPIRVRGMTIGVLNVDSSEPGFYSENHAERLQAFAAQAGIALHNAQLLEEATRRLGRLEALRAIDNAIKGNHDLNLTLNILLEQVIRELGIDAADILLYNARLQTLDYAAGRGFQTRALQYTRLRLGDGLAGQAALKNEMIRIDDLAADLNGLTRARWLPDEHFVSYYATPLLAKGQLKGVMEIFRRTPFEPDEEWLGFLEALAGQAAIAIENATLVSDLRRSNLELMLAYDTTLEGWSRALDLRDKETHGHTDRVTEMTVQLARRMGLGDAELAQLRRGALLHDIGKMAIPDSILLKSGPLTPEEWEIMRRHPTYAYELLAPIAYLRPALDIPYAHHEKWDGTGYPRGLVGEQIPLAARIFAVVDVWDALTSDRPYRRAWTPERARGYIVEQSGRHFDPKVVGQFELLLAQEQG